MSKNVLLLAPPLAGSRPLAKALVECGYDAGKCLASRLDPSESSFEDEQTVYVNSRLFTPHKSLNTWNGAETDNCFSFHLGTSAHTATWASHTAGPVLLRMSSSGKWVRKDFQFIYTYKHWEENVWRNSENKPVYVLINRQPGPWISSIQKRRLCGVWPHVADNDSYWAGLWTDYTNHMLRILQDPRLKDRVAAVTLEQLCMPSSLAHERLAKLIGVQPELFKTYEAHRMSQECSGEFRPNTLLWETWESWLKASITG